MHGTERTQKQKKLYPVTTLVCNMHTGSRFSVTLYFLPPLVGHTFLIFIMVHEFHYTQRECPQVKES